MNCFSAFLHYVQPFYRKNRPSLFAGLLVLLLCGFSVIPVLAPGIDQPTAIGPYLNGVFPRDAPSGTNGNWVVENAFPQLTFPDPLALVEVPGADSYYVVSKTGQIWQVADDPDAGTKETVLDISPLVDTDGDAGLLNAVLHPEFGQPGSPNRGYIYVFYRYHPDGNAPNCETGAFLRLSRFQRPDGSGSFDPNSELVLIQTFDEMCWHSGGAMFFDREGYLYLATGDAGGINDDFQTTQRINERFFGGLLRLDVDKDPSRSHPIRRQQVDPAYIPFTTESSYTQGYYIPNDNPWQDPDGGALEEFFAIGLRSPHRAAIDPLTGKIWVGDVGQGLREEISIISKGANLQWPFGEGFLPGDLSAPNPLIGISTPPVYDYSHDMGNSIIGGFVYRGDFYQGALNGQYLFGDHGSRNVWSYNPVNGEVSFLVNVPDFGSGEKNGISSFALNSAGEIFVLKLYGTDLDGGVVYRLKQGTAVPEPPQFLSQTGVFSDLATLSPAPGIVPYTVNAPLWSDRAAKKRWIALPNDGTHNSPDEQITFAADGNWQFPSGTVFIKHFELPLDYNNPAVTRPLETRFLVITADGGAYGVTYKWNEAGTDAVLLVNGVDETIPVTFPNGISGEQTWKFPSRTDCMTCHNANADFVLGVHTWQLNGELTYPGGITDNQLNTWNHLGMFANPFNPEEIPTFLKSVNIHDESAPLGTRVRSYLDANCAHCHQPNGVEGAFDARFSTPLEDQNILWTFSVSRNTPKDHYIIKPKDSSESEIWIRDSNLGGNAMPPLAKNLLDNDYLDVLADWIDSLEEEACAEKPVSSLYWTSAETRNTFVEINRSIGSEKPNDGLPITINGQVFPLGLGVHAYSKVTYQTRGDYAVFQSYVGVDDEVAACNAASVIFQVFADDQLVAESPLLKGGQDAFLIKADIQGAEEVSLVVISGEDGESCDHADWADPRFLPCATCTPASACDDGNPCTLNDVYDADCHCAGTMLDSDNDGICDADDQCPGFDDTADADGDGVPDACDKCNEVAGSPCDDGNACTTDDTYDADCNCAGTMQDSDNDGVCDADDQCPGFDDSLDTDKDDIPDGCDQCNILEGTSCDDGNACTDGDVYNADCHCVGTWQDSDDDGVCDAKDQCPGFSDAADIDLDGIPDGCDDNIACTSTFLTDLAWEGTPQNAYGPMRKDRSADNNVLSVNGRTFNRGLGAHAYSEVAYRLDRKYTTFYALIGVDDETDCDLGSVIFQVYTDGVLALTSPLKKSGEDVTPISVDVSQVNELKLVATIGNETDYCDHANWAEARLETCDPCLLQAGQACDDGDACTVADLFDNNCHCAGVPADADEDGVCDAEDKCPDADDTLDSNHNGIPDACDSSDVQVPMGAEPVLTIIKNVSLTEMVVQFKLKQLDMVQLLLLDQQGRVIHTLPAGRMPAGTHTLRLPPDLGAGLYYAQLHYTGGTVTEKVVIAADYPATRELAVSVRPNPFHDEFKLFITPPYPALKRAVIRILDVSGRVIYQKFDAPFNEEITIQPHRGWSNGVYIMHIHAGNYRFTHTMIRQ